MNSDNGNPFYVNYLGYVIPGTFPTRVEAEEWALWNYKGSREGWIVTTEREAVTPPKKETPSASRVATYRLTIRRAFDLIRRDPTRRQLRDDLAKALGGTGPLTDRMFEQVMQIVTASEQQRPNP